MTEIVAMLVATAAAVWLVFGPGDDGALRWFIATDTVAEKVRVVDDPALLSFIETAKAEGEETLATLNEEVDLASEAWKSAPKDDQAARLAAHEQYALAYGRKAEVEGALGVGALTDAYIGIKAPAAVIKVDPAPRGGIARPPTAREQASAARAREMIASIMRSGVGAVEGVTTPPAWAAGLEQFKMSHRERLLESINKALLAKNKPSKELDAATIGYGGIIKGGKVYIYHPEVAGQTFSVKLMFMVIVVTLSWIIGTFISKPVSKEVLYKFYRQCHPGGPGWAKVLRDAKAEGVDLKGREGVDWQMPLKLLCVFIGCAVIYGALFGIGSFVYGNLAWGIALSAVAIVGTALLMIAFTRIKTD